MPELSLTRIYYVDRPQWVSLIAAARSHLLPMLPGPPSFSGTTGNDEETIRFDDSEEMVSLAPDGTKVALVWHGKDWIGKIGLHWGGYLTSGTVELSVVTDVANRDAVRGNPPRK